MIELSAELQQLLQKRVVCFFATIMPNGSPQMTQTWVDTDGTYILINTVEGHQKLRNVQRDPRVMIGVVDPAHWERALSIRGRVVEITNERSVISMDYRRLGCTGLKISCFGLGTMQWGWTADEPTAVAVMDAFVEQGGNFLDTADFYSRWLPGHSGGESEEIIGRWMQRRGNRQEMIIATKVYQPMGEHPNDRGLSRKHIIEALEASLRRLHTDYIDLYLAHAFDAETPIEETLETLDDARRAGKIRYAGASNYPAWRFVEALWKAEVRHTLRFDCLEPHYNLVHRAEFEHDLKTMCQLYQIAVLPYSPLANGFLTGKYRRGQMQATESARAGSVRQRYDREEAWRALEAVEQIAKACGSTPTVIALAWLLAQSVVTTPILGARSVPHLESCLEALKVALTPDQLARLDTAPAWEPGEGEQ